ncbi:murein DD-endopeptidase MepM/ murein hydrolase activator NlpD [Hamadaea flava]|uniref:M23 family metallopeptidase n=1 Tax=Hamadaea flava TaxID=1742688 RepID=A0ABV8LXU1_9ACTN|nr:M23 family metallopeptidase [Hamadaea flava]MCP2329260.1 murein DD-endopeptidase MepM/ murein hydrolase activator NlpD [Hamadaea flava]
MQYRPQRLDDRDAYRGRRRAPAPPRRRYVAVSLTALAGAAIAATAVGTLLPDNKDDHLGAEGPAWPTQADHERTQAAELTSRQSRSSGSVTVADTASWVLPMRDYELGSAAGNGADLVIGEGTPFAAVHAGTVLVAEWRGSYGNMIMIDHGDGVVVLYGHASHLLVKPGDKVAAGQTIGLVGNTGRSAGPHLHLEVHVDGRPVGASDWFKDRGVNLQLQIQGL